MQHTFTQKFLLVLLAAALTAGAYVVVYKKMIVAADQSINAGYQKHGAPTPAAKRRY